MEIKMKIFHWFSCHVPHCVDAQVCSLSIRAEAFYREVIQRVVMFIEIIHRVIMTTPNRSFPTSKRS